MCANKYLLKMVFFFIPFAEKRKKIEYLIHITPVIRYCWADVHTHKKFMKI